jgi:hypothetical protein
MLNRPLWRRLLVFASALFLGVLVLGGLLMPRTAFTYSTTPQGVDKAAAAQCSLATLKGTYVAAPTGFQIVRNDRVPFAIAVVQTFDGKGRTQGVFSANVNGNVVAHQVRFTGTYTVKPDCTGTQTLMPAPGNANHYDTFTTPDGSLITSVQTDPGVVSASVLSRGTGQQAGN